MRLDGKVAIVTGAGQGIGRVYAQRLLVEGASVVVADVNAETGEQAVSELASFGPVRFALTDITDETSVADCVSTTTASFGRVDILVNNAALSSDLDQTDDSYPYLRRVFEVNLHGMWLMTRAVSALMVDQGAGRVINQASGSAYVYSGPPEPDFPGLHSYAYNLSKWSVIGLTRFLAGQLGQYNVTVNCVTPGLIDQPTTRAMMPPFLFDMVRNSSALKALPIAEDLAGTVVFLASDDAGLITGQSIVVDGGINMAR